MRKYLITLMLLILPIQVFAAKEVLETLSNTTGRSPKADNNFNAQNRMNTELYNGLAGKESSLGNPSTSGWCLQSTEGGVRSWGVCGGLADATADGKTYGRKNSAWVEVYPSGVSGQVLTYNSSGSVTATTVPPLTVAEVSALFTGTGEYLKKDGTTGTPVSGSTPALPVRIAYDPTSATGEGVYISTATSHQFAVYADGGVYDITAGTYTAPPSDPCADGLLANGCFDSDGTGWSILGGSPTFTGGKATLDYGDSISQSFAASSSGTTFFRAHLRFDALDNANSVFPIQLKSGSTVIASIEVRSTNTLRVNGGDSYVQANSLAPATDYYIWGSITTGAGSAIITARVGTTGVYDAATAYTSVVNATIPAMPSSIVAQAVTYDTGGMIYVDSLAVSETLIGDFNE